MDFSASAATKDAARLRRRRFCTPPRFFSTLPHTVARAELNHVRWSPTVGTWSSSQPRPDDEFETHRPDVLRCIHSSTGHHT